LSSSSCKQYSMMTSACGRGFAQMSSDHRCCLPAAAVARSTDNVTVLLLDGWLCTRQAISTAGATANFSSHDTTANFSSHDTTAGQRATAQCSTASGCPQLIMCQITTITASTWTNCWHEHNQGCSAQVACDSAAYTPGHPAHAACQ
jgi:hypothetical protein